MSKAKVVSDNKCVVVGSVIPKSRKYIQKPLMVPFGQKLREALSAKGIPVNRCGR